MTARKHSYKRVGVLGLGFVGLPLSLLLYKKGFQVTGIDIDENKLKALRAGDSYISEVCPIQLKEAFLSGKYEVSDSMDVLKRQDIIIVCVPTPLNENNLPDLSYLKSAGEAISQQLKSGHLIILESSTFPGTTRDIFLRILEQSGKKVGRDFHLAYSPERIDPGNEKFKVEEIPKIVSGVTPSCLTLVFEVYNNVYDSVVKVNSPEVAEITKLLENCYRYINISFINEFAMLCDKLNIDIWEVIKAASTKPYGFQPFFPGPGIGGHCIPVDPLYLKYKALQAGAPHQFIDLSQSINDSIPVYIAGQLEKIFSKPFQQLSVLIYGVTYKPDVKDIRGSSAIQVIEQLVKKGVDVKFHDPFVDEIVLESNVSMKGVKITDELLGSVDCVLILTDHTVIPVDKIIKHSKNVYDTRNVTRGLNGKAEVYRLGGGFDVV
ncbi:nucleotide sugar dehydrogenase [Halobacillus yeomjeoni]|uniref:nucleotide sugar dehydrogenase n=1 Tax=Halobacillus yeomjeoni TaxID=311194 RepID=UPI001CD3B4F7|nr:nucleotide sugar dehydrogenase [Halobacillus yeomjeoni]MCA0984939.1 nucleotide sugar dehydrogenase [Halobacillus yeomjeoni]